MKEEEEEEQDKGYKAEKVKFVFFLFQYKNIDELLIHLCSYRTV